VNWIIVWVSGLIRLAERGYREAGFYGRMEWT